MTAETPTVDFLILADRVEVINGKMYMMGGGWDRLFIHDFGQPAAFSIGVSVVVPWNSTNEQHRLELRILDADGATVVPPAQMTFVAGRPPMMRAGETQRIMMAINGTFKLPKPGTYVVAAAVNGLDSGRTLFYAVQAQAQTNLGAGPMVQA